MHAWPERVRQVGTELGYLEAPPSTAQLNLIVGTHEDVHGLGGLAIPAPKAMSGVEDEQLLGAVS
jgi:hypothetical protein